MANEIALSKNTNKTVQCTVTSGGSPLSLSGASIKLLVKDKLSDADDDAVITKVSTEVTQIEITDAGNGVFKVYFVPADTASLTPGKYTYDIRLKLSNGKQYVIPSPAAPFEIASVVVETALA